ncbi:MAG: hypothetical protein J7M09_05365 [Deltaproteobacteria bacterium]|nr:hypothetical protein [Candidatus Tharpella sp.]
MLRRRFLKVLFCWLVLLFLLLNFTGCASLVVDPLLESLSRSLEQETDIDLLVDGSPTLLLLINGFIKSDPGNLTLLRAGTRAFSAYAILLDETGKPERARLASEKARTYGFELLGRKPEFGESIKQPLAVFKQSLSVFAKADATDLFLAGQAWALWIKLRGGAPAAMVDLPKVEEMMLRVIELDESVCFGSAHLVLGSIYCSLSPMLGGKPAAGRRHFERALTLSNRQFWPVQVAYADGYARQTFKRELFTQLLNEVISQPLVDNEMATANRLARKKAAELLAQIDDIF